MADKPRRYSILATDWRVGSLEREYEVCSVDTHPGTITEELCRRNEYRSVRVIDHHKTTEA